MINKSEYMKNPGLNIITKTVLAYPFQGNGSMTYIFNKINCRNSTINPFKNICFTFEIITIDLSPHLKNFLITHRPMRSSGVILQRRYDDTVTNKYKIHIKAELPK